jgi:hypothetical protein
MLAERCGAVEPDWWGDGLSAGGCKWEIGMGVLDPSSYSILAAVPNDHSFGIVAMFIIILKIDILVTCDCC